MFGNVRKLLKQAISDDQGIVSSTRILGCSYAFVTLIVMALVMLDIVDDTETKRDIIQNNLTFIGGMYAIRNLKINIGNNNTPPAND
jgi:hypothetical protein